MTHSATDEWTRALTGLAEAWQAAAASLRPKIESVHQAMAAAGVAWAAELRGRLEAARPALEQIYAALQGAYRDAGAPYGDTHEGLSRWLEEQGAIYRAAEQSRTDASWQRSLTTLRAHVQEEHDSEHEDCPHCHSVRWNRAHQHGADGT